MEMDSIYDEKIRPKDLRPDLHVKSHFKGTQSLSLKPKIHYSSKEFRDSSSRGFDEPPMSQRNSNNHEDAL